jgi:hypothetical protein
VVHEAPLGKLVEGPVEFGCNVYASGEHLNIECIMVRAWGHMLDWFGRLSSGEENAEEKWEIPETEGDIDAGSTAAATETTG